MIDIRDRGTNSLKSIWIHRCERQHSARASQRKRRRRWHSRRRRAHHSIRPSKQPHFNQCYNNNSDHMSKEVVKLTKEGHLITLFSLCTCTLCYEISFHVSQNFTKKNENVIPATQIVVPALALLVALQMQVIEEPLARVAGEVMAAVAPAPSGGIRGFGVAPPQIRVPLFALFAFRFFATSTLLSEH